MKIEHTYFLVWHSHGIYAIVLILFTISYLFKHNPRAFSQLSGGMMGQHLVKPRWIFAHWQDRRRARSENGWARRAM